MIHVIIYSSIKRVSIGTLINQEDQNWIWRKKSGLVTGRKHEPTWDVGRHASQGKFEFLLLLDI